VAGDRACLWLEEAGWLAGWLADTARKAVAKLRLAASCKKLLIRATKIVARLENELI
jgi:hypothetical protein